MTSRSTRRWAHCVAALMLAAGCAGTAWADPPARAARLSWSAGDVTLHAAAGDAGAPASINWPVTAGNVIDTGPSGRAEVTLGTLAFQLDVNSEVQVQQLDDAQLRLQVTRGSLGLRSGTAQDAATTSVDTPLGRLTEPAPGAYRVDLRGSAVEATAWHADLVFSGGSSLFTVPAGQHVQLLPAPAGISMAMLPAAPDDFERFVQARHASFSASVSGTTHYVSPAMTGAESLDRYGRWESSAEYGPIWVPEVAAGWAPYRYGRWAWVEPWGWNWIDDAPWGFAPFHYGRWALVGERWGWVPGSYVARPVYAPALVAWRGAPPARPGATLSVSIGASAGWFPLAPHEVYVPPYRVSEAYVRNVNVTHVTNITNITNVMQANAAGGSATAVRPAQGWRFQAEPRAFTQVQAHAMQQPVARAVAAAPAPHEPAAGRMHEEAKPLPAPHHAPPQAQRPEHPGHEAASEGRRERREPEEHPHHEERP